MQVKIPHNLKLLMTGQHHTPVTLFMKEKFNVHIGHGVGKTTYSTYCMKGKNSSSARYQTWKVQAYNQTIY